MQDGSSKNLEATRWKETCALLEIRTKTLSKSVSEPGNENNEDFKRSYLLINR